MANTMEVLFGPQPAGVGNKHIYTVKLSIDTYASGGVAVDVPASITKPVVFAQASKGYVAEFDATNKKVVLYTTANTEVTTLSSAVNVVLMFVGQ